MLSTEHRLNLEQMGSNAALLARINARLNGPRKLRVLSCGAGRRWGKRQVGHFTLLLCEFGPDYDATGGEAALQKCSLSTKGYFSSTSLRTLPGCLAWLPGCSQPACVRVACRV